MTGPFTLLKNPRKVREDLGYEISIEPRDTFAAALKYICCASKKKPKESLDPTPLMHPPTMSVLNESMGRPTLPQRLQSLEGRLLAEESDKKRARMSDHELINFLEVKQLKTPSQALADAVFLGGPWLAVGTKFLCKLS
jgi:hypothetical protein